MDEIQADESKVSDYLTNTTLKSVFEYTYDPSKKWLLPEGFPPYREAPEPLGMTPTNFLQTVRTWPNYSRSDILPTKRESLFINLLEGVHKTESRLLIGIKEGIITNQYPFATKEFGEKHGFLTQISQGEEPQLN